jgi:hypothetical protein
MAQCCPSVTAAGYICSYAVMAIQMKMARHAVTVMVIINRFVEILLFIFRVVQTGFLTRYAKYIFASSLGLYYGLLILFLTNTPSGCEELF